MEVCGSFIMFISKLDSNDLDQILGEFDELFKWVKKIRLLGLEDLSTKIDIYSHSIDISLFEKRIGKAMSSIHFISIEDVLGNCLKVSNGVLLVIYGCIRSPEKKLRIVFYCFTRIVKIAVTISVIVVDWV